LNDVAEADSVNYRPIV